jgi:hypothetical protein
MPKVSWMLTCPVSPNHKFAMLVLQRRPLCEDRLSQSVRSLKITRSSLTESVRSLKKVLSALGVKSMSVSCIERTRLCHPRLYFQQTCMLEVLSPTTERKIIDVGECPVGRRERTSITDSVYSADSRDATRNQISPTLPMPLLVTFHVALILCVFVESGRHCVVVSVEASNRCD